MSECHLVVLTTPPSEHCLLSPLSQKSFQLRLLPSEARNALFEFTLLLVRLVFSQAGLSVHFRTLLASSIHLLEGW